MRWLFFIVGLSLLIIAWCQFPNADSILERKKTEKTEKKPFYLGGIHVNEASLENWTNTVQQVGMNTIEVTNYGKQWDWDSDTIFFDKDLSGQINEIREAKKKGLKVVMVLRVQLQHWVEKNYFLWHGMIMPKNDTLLLSWFQKYKEFNLQWAKICQEEGVDVMVIGSELNALASTVPIQTMPPLYTYYNNRWLLAFREKRLLKYKNTLQEKNLGISGYHLDKNGDTWLEDFVDARITAHHNWSKAITFGHQKHRLKAMNQRRKLIKNQWVELIQNVRKIYKGKLTYAANYDNYQEVDFWDQLDFIGINAYFPLRSPTEDLPPKTELLAKFEKNWKNIFTKINQFKKNKNLKNKPLLFTELGYTYYPNSTVESWNGSGFALLGQPWNEKLVVWEEQDKCPQERYLAIEALRKVVQSYRTYLQGILYWKLTTHDYLIKEESFALHINPSPTDSLQNALVKFLEDEP